MEDVNSLDIYLKAYKDSEFYSTATERGADYNKLFIGGGVGFDLLEDTLGIPDIHENCRRCDVSVRHHNHYVCVARELLNESGKRRIPHFDATEVVC